MSILQIVPTMPPQQVGEIVSDRLNDGDSFVHISGTSIDAMDVDSRAVYITVVAEVIGALTLTNQIPDTKLWLLDTSTSPASALIPLHTDNPYLADPEDVLSFWSIQASERGGENLVMPVMRLLEIFYEKSGAVDLLDEVAAATVNFSNGKVSTLTTIIKDNSNIAFDKKYLVGAGSDLGNRFGAALDTILHFSDVIRLAPGDALFINNNTNLHGRTPYNDPNRVSIRARMQRVVPL